MFVCFPYAAVLAVWSHYMAGWELFAFTDRSGTVKSVKKQAQGI